MKFSKRVAYCGSLSALMFSLGAGAMQGQDQAQEDCSKGLECSEPDYSQTVPPLFTEKDDFEDYCRNVDQDYRCKVIITRSATDTTIVKGILKIHRQENWGSANNNHETYTVQKVEYADEKCSAQQEVSQLVDQLNSEQFARTSDKQVVEMVSAEGQAYQTDIVTFQDDTIEFTMRRVGTSTGPNETRNYQGKQALRMIGDYVSRASAIQSLLHVDGKFNELDLGPQTKKAKRKAKK